MCLTQQPLTTVEKVCNTRRSIFLRNRRCQYQKMKNCRVLNIIHKRLQSLEKCHTIKRSQGNSHCIRFKCLNSWQTVNAEAPEERCTSVTASIKAMCVWKEGIETLHTRDKCEGGVWQQCKVLGREARQGQVGYTRDTSEGECTQGTDRSG